MNDGKRLTYAELRGLDDGYKHAYTKSILDTDKDVSNYLNTVKANIKASLAEKAQLMADISKIQGTWEKHQKDFDSKMADLVAKRRELEKHERSGPEGKMNLQKIQD